MTEIILVYLTQNTANIAKAKPKAAREFARS